MKIKCVDKLTSLCKDGVLFRLPAQRASPPLADRFAAYCAQWLRGSDPRLRRAATQTLGLLAGVEGARFGRRVPPLLSPLLAMLRQQPDQASCCLTTCKVIGDTITVLSLQWLVSCRQTQAVQAGKSSSWQLHSWCTVPNTTTFQAVDAHSQGASKQLAQTLCRKPGVQVRGE